MRLDEIAEIRMGYTFRSEIEVLNPLKNGSSVSEVLFAIQMRDIDEEGRIRPGSIVPVKRNQIAMRQLPLLDPGDIIFKSRGKALTVTLFDPEEIRTTIDYSDWNIDPGVHSVFILAAPLQYIRVTIPERVTPSFLLRYLKTDLCREEMERKAMGSTLPMVKIGSLKTMEIPVPSLEKQRMIVDLAELTDSEQNLLRSYAAIRKQYLNRIIAESLLSESHPEDQS